MVTGPADSALILTLAAAALMGAGGVAILVGLILRSITRRFQELDHQIRTLADDMRL